jgi:hypothetical protein
VRLVELDLDQSPTCDSAPYGELRIWRYKKPAWSKLGRASPCIGLPSPTCLSGPDPPDRRRRPAGEKGAPGTFFWPRRLPGQAAAIIRSREDLDDRLAVLQRTLGRTRMSTGLALHCQTRRLILFSYRHKREADRQRRPSGAQNSRPLRGALASSNNSSSSDAQLS